MPVVRRQIHVESGALSAPAAIGAVVERAAASGTEAVVVTGGEPLLYPWSRSPRPLRARGLRVFLETSGAHPFSGTFDWVCLSPKRQHPPSTRRTAGPTS